MFSEFIYVLVQLVMLYYWNIQYIKSSRIVLYQYFTPVGWLTFFYLFWFIAPQLLAVFSGGMIVGFDNAAASAKLVLPSQRYITLFLFSIVFGNLFYRALRLRSADLSYKIQFGSHVSMFDLSILLVLFALGLYATNKLGNTFLESEGMRSELVKTSGGKFLTILSLWGGFCFAYLLGRYVVRKQLLVAGLFVFAFASVAIFTGARGRLLWPMVLAFVYFSACYNRFNVVAISISGLVILFILSILDPLVAAVRQGDMESFFANVGLEQSFTALFFKRNFDSFSNFTLISTFDQVPYKLSILVTGARDTFMNYYYPAVYESGVGFGVTYPGTFWLAGGVGMLVAGGLGFGVVLGVITKWLYRLRDERLYWMYLQAMPWICALGGNFMESIDKMAVAIFIPLAWYMKSRLMNILRQRR